MRLFTSRCRWSFTFHAPFAVWLLFVLVFVLFKGVSSAPVGDMRPAKSGSFWTTGNVPSNCNFTASNPICDESGVENIWAAYPQNATADPGTIHNYSSPPAILEVNSTADTDDGTCLPLGFGNGCTLREAINAANLSNDLSTINFNIPDADPNCNPMVGVTGEVCTIAPTSSLPTINFQTMVDGYSQPGASPNTLAVGSNVLSTSNLTV